MFNRKVQAQTTLYSESFDSGNPTGWTISGGSATYSWSSASPSTNYQGASGNYNARNGTATTAILVFNNSLSTIGYTNLCVSWGAYRTSGNSLDFYWSTDGSNWNQTTFTDVSATSYWGLVTVTLPAGAENASNLQFKFISQSTAGTNRIDDFKVQSNAGTGNWSLTGNSNATSTGFLGTTNAQDLVFKTNNTERARILSNGNFGIGTNNPQAKLSIVGDAILNFSGNQFGDITSSTSIRPHLQEQILRCLKAFQTTARQCLK
ncbi:MAG: hypothetical protein IT239_04390 [Bacteroidia bacterium]|nr:hypothetical protein [Bacteroidia bacterium]